MPDLRDFKPLFSRHSWRLLVSVVLGLLTFRARKSLIQLAINHSVDSLAPLHSRRCWLAGPAPAFPSKIQFRRGR